MSVIQYYDHATCMKIKCCIYECITAKLKCMYISGMHTYICMIMLVIPLASLHDRISFKETLLLFFIFSNMLRLSGFPTEWLNYFVLPNYFTYLNADDLIVPLKLQLVHPLSLHKFMLPCICNYQ